MSKWEKVKLGDVASYVKDKINCNMLDSTNYISTENMLANKEGVIKANSIPIGKATLYLNNDILISNIRPYFKKIWFANNSGGCSADVLCFRGTSQIYSKFLYYTLSNDIFFEYSVASSKGTKMPRGDKEALLQYPINLPPLEEQKRIAAILSSLDDKIEVNNKINKNLEEQAQAIFTSWFVDFEPFGGVMPSDWEIGTLENIATISNKTFNPLKESLTLLEHYSIPAFDSENFPVFEPSSNVKSNKFAIDEKCCLISKLNPTTKRVWKPFCMSGNAVCSTEFIVYKAKQSIMTDYLYATIDSANFSDFMCSHVTGSTGSRQRTTPSATLNYILPIPSQETLRKFSKIMTSYYEKIKNNHIECSNIKKTRDALLPKLMTGETNV